MNKLLKKMLFVLPVLVFLLVVVTSVNAQRVTLGPTLVPDTSSNVYLAQAATTRIYVNVDVTNGNNYYSFVVVAIPLNAPQDSRELTISDRECARSAITYGVTHYTLECYVPSFPQYSPDNSYRVDVIVKGMYGNAESGGPQAQTVLAEGTARSGASVNFNVDLPPGGIPPVATAVPTACPVPAVPTGLKVTRADQYQGPYIVGYSYALGWNSVATASSYNVQFSPDNITYGPPTSVVGTSTNVSSTSQTGNFSLSARNGCGDSSTVSASYTSPTPTAIPNQPTVSPAATIVPTIAPVCQKDLGDANCVKNPTTGQFSIDEADFVLWLCEYTSPNNLCTDLAKIAGMANYVAKSANFNFTIDQIVDLQDYEIWRNTVYR